MYGGALPVSFKKKRKSKKKATLLDKICLTNITLRVGEIVKTKNV